MRLIQNFLLLIGATAFGLGAGALGSYACMLMLFEEPRGESFGAAPIWLAAIAFGGIVGAIVGFATAVRRIIYSKNRRWTRYTWMGVILGAAVGLFASVHLPDRIHFWFRLICAGFIVGAYITIGTILSGIVVRFVKQWNSNPR